MYLKGIELTGFKSFADKTRLTFEPGVTSVVGPNGSGKSNISDAIRWVMGEMSAKSLRGANMQDVIFAGTQTRKPLGFAQVSLTLDNSDHALGIEYGEVTVTRRVYRSGESEYAINGASCRLKDIHELFMDTGLGRDGYSIIGQGKVNEIISGKADDRRGIFDEAAGISKYRHRKEEAERKLAHTEENLVRVNDIVAELSSQVEPLFKQSQKARQYLDLREEMKKLEINLFLQTVDRLKREIADTAKSFAVVTEQLTAMQAENAKTDEEIDRVNALADALEEKIEARRGENADAELRIKGLLGEAEVLKNTAASNETLIGRIGGEIAQLEQKIEGLSQTAEAIALEKQEKQAALTQLEEEAAQAAEESQAFSGRALALGEEINAIKAGVIEKLNDIAALKAKLSSLEAFKKSFLQRREAILLEKESMGAELAQIEEARQKAAASAEAAQRRMDAEQKELASLTERAEAAQRALAAAKDDAAAKNAVLTREQSRLHMLMEMEKDFEGFAKSVKGVLAAHKDGRLGGAKVHGALSSLIGVPKEYVTAIEALLGGALQNVVVESEQDAKTAIEYLKRSHLGRVTFLPVSSVKGRTLENQRAVGECPGYVGLASELVSCDARYDAIIASLLGRCVVVDTMDHAIAVSRKFGYKFRVATLEGELLNAGGSITGGSMNKTTGLLSRAAEIHTLRASTKEKQAALDVVLARQAALEQEMEQLAAARRGTDALLRTAEQDLIRARAEQEHVESLAQAKKLSGESMEGELAQIEEQMKDANEQIAELINQTTKEELTIEADQQKAAEQEAALAELEATRGTIAERVNETNIALTAARKDIAACDYRIRDTKAQAEAAQGEIAAKQADIDGLKEKNSSIAVQVREKEEQAAAVQEQAKTLLGAVAALCEERDAARTRARNLLEENKEAREQIYALKEEQSRIDNKRIKQEGELDAITAKIWEEYEVTYLSAKEYETDVGPISAAKGRVGELRAKIRALGNVNVDAIEEYKSVKERFDFLSGQAADLAGAKESLEKLIESIQEKMKKQFKEQFAVIGRHFSETFAELFGGGRAELRLTDPDDVLGSGVEIDAQPPGKKLQNLSLLSGGEMAFTAIALLFAILKVRPTPFCVLDEIEAALDESNVYRFADYVKAYSKKTQFILVTHRRGTMEAADLLYGVTMQEKGVSKLLALHLDEAVRTAQAK